MSLRRDAIVVLHLHRCVRRLDGNDGMRKGSNERYGAEEHLVAGEMLAKTDCTSVSEGWPFQSSATHLEHHETTQGKPDPSQESRRAIAPA